MARSLISDNTGVALGHKPIYPWGRIKHFDYHFNNAHDLHLLEELGVKLGENELLKKLEWVEPELNQLNLYFKANLLLIDCLQVAALSDRHRIGSRLLLPPDSKSS